MSLHIHRKTPLIGVGIGLGAGMVARTIFLHRGSWLWSTKPVMKPLLPVLNAIKQVEMKGAVKFVSPFLPELGAMVQKRTMDTPSKHRVGALLVSCATVLFLLGFRDLLLLRTNSFNASGHVIMASVLSWNRTASLEAKQPTVPQLAQGITVLYAASDALFLFNTAACFHSIADLTGGIALGMLCCFAGQCTAGYLTNN